jgi:HlyD family secretion protein
MNLPPLPPLRKLLPPLIVLLVLALAVFAWMQLNRDRTGTDFISGNGRIEAIEIDVAAKLPGRIQEILVGDGDFVQAGQVLARMQVDTLNAQLAEARANLQQAQNGITIAQSQTGARDSDVQAALAVVAQRESELDAARRRLARSETLAGEGAASAQELDDDRARARNVQAALSAATRAAAEAARAQIVGARSSVAAVEAAIARIEADLKDSELKAPRAGRVQYRIAQVGEVLGSGGKVLNLVDLSDVYMTFFVPETAAGKLALGGEVHLILDAAPQYVIPAKISFVASTAQFTPKTVETASERQKLMFRVKAQIDRALLEKHITKVKTGLPGVAWVKLSPTAEWPAHLQVKLPAQ